MTSEHYIVFGAEDQPDKGLFAYQCDDGLPGKYAVAIVGLDNDGSIGYGGRFGEDQIKHIFTTLYFCKLESLDSMILALEQVRDAWREDVEGDS